MCMLLVVIFSTELYNQRVGNDSNKAQDFPEQESSTLLS